LVAVVVVGEAKINEKQVTSLSIRLNTILGYHDAHNVSLHGVVVGGGGCGGDGGALVVVVVVVVDETITNKNITITANSKPPSLHGGSHFATKMLTIQAFTRLWWWWWWWWT
jgi:hypothetical protein